MPATRTPKSLGKARATTAVSKETVFKVPDVPPTASTSSLPRPDVPPTASTSSLPRTRKARKPLFRDVGAQLLARHGSADAVLEASATFDREFLSHIGPSTQKLHDTAERYWISHFTVVLKSEEAAKATLQKGAPFPPVHLVIQFIYETATVGASGLGIPGLTGWSVHHTRTFVGTVLSMRNRKGAQKITNEQREQLFNAITKWSAKDKILATDKRPKRIVREIDLIELVSAFLRSGTTIHSNELRIKALLACLLLYLFGSRPGCIFPPSGHEGSGQHLKWSHLEIIVVGWDEGLGVRLEVFWTFHFAKGMRDDNSMFIQSSSRSLSRERLHIDLHLPLLALGISAGVFDCDILELHTPGGQPASYPYVIPLKSTERDKPVFTSSDGRGGPMTYSSLLHVLRKVVKRLGWRDFVPKSFRYAFAGYMLNRIPEVHLKYLMGHGETSHLAKTTYQVPDRPIDVTGSRFNEGDVRDLADLHSSIAWNRSGNALESTISADTLRADVVMQNLLHTLSLAEQSVVDKYGKASKDFSQDDTNDLVEAADECWIAVMERYADLATQANRTFLPGQLQQNLAAHAQSSSVDSRITARHRPSAPTARAHASSVVSTASSMSIDAACVVNNPVTDSAPLPSMSGTPCDGLMDEILPVPVSDDLIAEVIESLEGLVSNPHPFIPLIRSDRINPRHTILLRYFALLKADTISNSGLCPWCHADETLSIDQRNKKVDSLSIHIYDCVAERNPGHWQCPICLDLVRRPDNEDIGLKQLEQEHLEAHQAACFDHALVVMGLREDSTCALDSVLENVEREARNDASASIASSSGSSSHVNVLPAARAQRHAHARRDYGQGAALGVRSKIGNSTIPSSRLFCPICFFSEDLSWEKRLKPQTDTSKLYHHLRTHFTPRTVTGPPFVYARTFHCSFPPCTGNKTMNTGAMITHLHVAHGYILVSCEHDHHGVNSCHELCDEDHHTPECFILPDNQFVWRDDAVFRLENYGEDLPSATVVDYRKKDSKKRASAKMMSKAAAKANGAQDPSLASSTSSTVSLPASPAVENTHPLDPAPVVSIDEANLRECVAAFVQERSISGGQDLANLLVIDKIFLPDLAETPAWELRSLVPGLALGDARAFLVFASKWKD